MKRIQAKQFICALIALDFLLLGQVAGAMELLDLYQAEVPVKDQTQRQRNSVYPAALSQVVVKLSGDRTVAELPRLAQLMENARSLVQQYHYEDLPAGNEALLEAGFTRNLVVRFDRDALIKGLIEAEVPLWGHTRPEMLLWLAIEDREARYLLASNASLELESQLFDVARSRGLPMMLPLLDLEDRQRLGFADVWGDFHQTILDASNRYNVDAILVGRLNRTASGTWQGRWSLYQGSGSLAVSEYWQDESNMNADALQNAINTAADLIARRYVQLFSADAGDFVYLNVGLINSLGDYARAMQYLESIDTVAAVQVAGIQADEVKFRLAMRGDLDGLMRTISLGNTLRKVEATADFGFDTAAMGEALVYQLLP